ncbi:PQQ-binding-like beta-propeller repeat protein [Halomontanus rarus]|uniref:beta-alanine-activating enzyme beta-propeller domain-containing protein n=1 Tax=Halomontanus rarus TaxID=3034020 RepID=UPI00307B559B
MFDDFFEKIGLRSTNGVPPGGDDRDENRRSTRGRVSDRITGVPPVTRALFARIASADARAVALALVLLLSVPAMAVGSVGATMGEAEFDESSSLDAQTVGSLNLNLSTQAQSGGTVYIGSDDGSLYALSADTGDVKWEHSTVNSVRSSPTVADGTVYVGSYNNSVYALNASSGDVEWEHSTGDNVHSSPTVADGTVYVGSYDNSVYALNASSGDVEWEHSVGGGMESSPTVADGTVYFGSLDDSLYALSADTGDVEWEHPTGGAVQSSPTVADGTVYVGSGDDSVYALNASSGDVEWEHSTGGTVYSSPTVADGTVFVGSWDSSLYALSADTGDVEWEHSTGSTIQSSPTVADGTVYVGSQDNSLYALSADTGDVEWEHSTGDNVHSSPTVADGTVYAGSYDSSVYALSADSGDELWSSATGGSIGHSSPTFVPDGGNQSEGSRVALKTLGHHNSPIDDGDGGDDENVTFTQKYRLRDFTDTFDPALSQVVIETPSGDPVDVDQFGPENRAEVELEHLETYRISVTNQNGDKYVWGERNATKPIEIEVGGETTVIGDLDTIYIGSGSDIENDDDGNTWVDREPGPGDFNQPPIAMFEPDPYAPIVGETVTFDASGSSDVDGEVVSYDWTFSDGSSATGEVVTKSFSENGTHDVDLTVEDDDGGTATWEIGIYVAETEDGRAFPPEPVMSIQPEATPTGELVTFDASGSYGVEGEIVEYNWQIGSVEREGEVVDESFGGAGIKEVKLTVIDENGAHQSVRGEVIVYEEADEGSFMAVGPPLEPGDGILPGSLTGLGFVLLVGTVATGGLFAIDQRTSITIPKWAYALPAGATAFMVAESVSPGVLTLPIMRALDVVGPLLIIGALAIVYLIFRGWRDARAADRIQSLQNR